MATSKTTNRAKVGGVSKLKSNKNNKLIIAIVVLIVALVGGFFVYRSFAAGRQVAYAHNGGLRFTGHSGQAELKPDGPSTVYELRPSANGWIYVKSANSMMSSNGKVYCLYYALLDSNGRLIPRTTGPTYGSTVHSGVGNYQKDCVRASSSHEVSGSINARGATKVRVLKLVNGDDQYASPFSKNPYY